MQKAVDIREASSNKGLNTECQMQKMLGLLTEHVKKVHTHT